MDEEINVGTDREEIKNSQRRQDSSVTIFFFWSGLRFFYDGGNNFIGFIFFLNSKLQSLK